MNKTQTGNYACWRRKKSEKKRRKTDVRYQQKEKRIGPQWRRVFINTQEAESEGENMQKRKKKESVASLGYCCSNYSHAKAKKKKKNSCEFPALIPR